MQKEIKIIINGRKIKAKQGQTILQAAKEHGIEIPTLCYHPEFTVKANCRICLVSIKGRDLPQTACTTKIDSCMEITTESPELAELKKTNLELIFSQHKEECPDCVWNSNCYLLKLAKKYGLQITRFPDRKNDFPVYEFKPKPNEDSKGGTALIFDSSKCIDCRNCVEACEKQKVRHLKIISRNNLQEIVPDDKRPCVFCGQCILSCPSGAFEGTGEFEDIEKPLFQKDKKVVFQFAPAVRTTFGEEFGLFPGTNLTGQIIAGLKELGANFVFDTSCGADFTTFEGADESLERLEKNENLPMFSSCCPAWVRFIEIYYPNLIPHFTTIRSPQIILGGLIKTYWAQKNNIAPENIFVVSIMPCVAKKYEITREELKIYPVKSAGGGLQPIDYVLTTRELARLFKKYKIDPIKIKPQAPDNPLGEFSGAGVIYGTSGGVMESALRTANSILSQGLKTPKNASQKLRIEFQEVRGQNGLKIAELDFCGKKVKVAVANGLNNAVEIIENLDKKFKDFACIEVMACPGGCIGGGGQPLPTTAEIRKARAQGLYKIDAMKEIRLANENPALKQVYQEFLTSPEIRQKICHTRYSPKDE